MPKAASTWPGRRAAEKLGLRVVLVGRLRLSGLRGMRKPPSRLLPEAGLILRSEESHLGGLATADEVLHFVGSHL
ncbi:MAG: hypothetical protein SV966_09665 [Actinomycetota bacterium]|nr:hypothetical protein [Actinomycetota bacterium]